MNPNVIQFACGHCQSWLTVPAQMAGVAGPCPKCGNHIVSPQATAEPAAPAVSNWAPVENPVPQVYGNAAPQWPGAGLQQSQEPYPQAAQMPPPQAYPAAPQNEFFPPAPAAQPMVPPPVAQPSWSPPAAQANPDNGLPGGYPLHTQGLRPNAGISLPPARSTALPPPIGQPHPQAGMPGQMPIPGQVPAGAGMMGYDPSGQTGMLTRPASVGGSRLSLLARQLTTPPEGAPGLPMAPAPLSTAELPGQAPMAYNAPASKNQHAGDMAVQQSMRKGLIVGRSKSGGKTKFALAALLLIGLLGALVWQYRAPIQDIVAQVFPPKPSLPETTEPASATQVPGVSKVEASNSTTVTSRPEAAPDTTPPPASDRPMVARGIPVPAPEEVKGVETAPTSRPQETPVETKPMAPKTTKEGLELMATINAPRAQAVDEKDEVKPLTPPKPDPTPGNPLIEGQQKMVEVGRTNTDPKISQNAPPAPVPTLAAGQPSLKNVPPACKPAVDGLISFLNARNWKERMKFIQLPDQMEPKLKLYYGSNPDGPIDVDEIQYLRHDESPQVGKGLHAVFVLFSRNWEYGFPVMVEVTPDGARVDWLTFIEFKDDMLNKFMSNYMEERVQFHVGIHRTHYFDDNIPGLDQKEQFSVTSPMANVRGFVFVPKGTPFARSLASTISWDKEASWVVVELQWRKEGSAKWVEMTALPQLNWYSASAAPAKEPSASAVSAPPPPPAPKGLPAK